MTTLPFGYSAGLPPDIPAAWGARVIAYQTGALDFVPNRQGFGGPDGDPGPEATEKLAAFVNANCGKALATATDLLKGYEMSTREAQAFILYVDATGMIVGNTNGSAGYLYLAAWTWEDAGTDVSTVAKYDEAIRAIETAIDARWGAIA